MAQKLRRSLVVRASWKEACRSLLPRIRCLFKNLPLLSTLLGNIKTIDPHPHNLIYWSLVKVRRRSKKKVVRFFFFRQLSNTKGAFFARISPHYFLYITNKGPLAANLPFRSRCPRFLEIGTWETITDPINLLANTKAKGGEGTKGSHSSEERKHMPTNAVFLPLR